MLVLSFKLAGQYELRPLENSRPTCHTAGNDHIDVFFRVHWGSVSRATSEPGHVGILFALTTRGESKREFTQNKGAPVAFGHHHHNCVRETY